MSVYPVDPWMFMVVRANKRAGRLWVIFAPRQLFRYHIDLFLRWAQRPGQIGWLGGVSP